MSDSSVTPWTAVCHAPLSAGFPRQEYRSIIWARIHSHRSGLPFPSLGGLLDLGVEPSSPALAVSCIESRFLTSSSVILVSNFFFSLSLSLFFLVVSLSGFCMGVMLTS